MSSLLSFHWASTPMQLALKGDSPISQVLTLGPEKRANSNRTIKFYFPSGKGLCRAAGFSRRNCPNQWMSPYFRGWYASFSSAISHNSLFSFFTKSPGENRIIILVWSCWYFSNQWLQSSLVNLVDYGHPKSFTLIKFWRLVLNSFSAELSLLFPLHWPKT